MSNPTSERHFFAWDPGEVRNGFAWFEIFPDHVNLKLKSIIPEPSLFKFMESIEKYTHALKVITEAVVCENYRVRNESGTNGKYGRRSANSYGWDEVATIRVIGQVQKHAYGIHGHPRIALSEPKLLDTGRKWVDFPVPPKGHIPDDISAYIHGASYLMKMGYIRSCDEIWKQGQAPMVTGIQRSYKMESDPT